MSRRFQALLNRSTQIRCAFEDELRKPQSSFVRLFRLQRLQMRITEQLQRIVRARAIRRASAPRLPALHARHRAGTQGFESRAY